MIEVLLRRCAFPGQIGVPWRGHDEASCSGDQRSTRFGSLCAQASLQHGKSCSRIDIQGGDLQRVMLGILHGQTGTIVSHYFFQQCTHFMEDLLWCIFDNGHSVHCDYGPT
jgi:hypothetical protein